MGVRSAAPRRLTQLLKQYQHVISREESRLIAQDARNALRVRNASRVRNALQVRNAERAPTGSSDRLALVASTTPRGTPANDATAPPPSGTLVFSRATRHAPRG
ncbi:MAG: hypothetical protein AAGI15_09455 [Pseudomonadota bacterium]